MAGNTRDLFEAAAPIGDGSGSAAGGIASGRRARAGTLPSALVRGPMMAPSSHIRDSSLSVSGSTTPFNHGGQRDPFSSDEGLFGIGLAAVGSSIDNSTGLGPDSGSMGANGQYPTKSFASIVNSRPSLRHTASSAATLTAGSSGKISEDALRVAERMRSGSLLGAASNTEGLTPQVERDYQSWPNRPAMRSTLSYVSGGSSSGSGGSGSNQSNRSGGSYGHSTLDYLGLGTDFETPRAADFASFSKNDYNNYPTTAAGSRHRASTVSDFVRPPESTASSSSYSDLITAANLGLGSQPRLPVGMLNQNQFSLDTNYGLYDADLDRLYKDGSQTLLNSSGSMSRPRATTISMLEPQSKQSSRAIAPPERNENKDFASMHRPLAPRHAAHSSISSAISATGSTTDQRDHQGHARGESQGQTPTRSLWLGNLDVLTTAQQLNDVFKHYGAIESLRLLPEKSCAFVNFVDRADAIRAKDDILIRLGGHLPSLSDTPIRVGYGKIDSVPTAAPSSSTLKYSMSSSSLSSMASGASDVSGPEESSGEAGKSNGASGWDPNAQPSRALWVGSIPATTTPGTLLSIFAPFGAVESARVLTNKQCGFVNFESIDAAIAARTALNGREILGPEVGAIKIGFAKIPVRGPNAKEEDPAELLDALKDVKGTSAVSHENVANIENYGSNLVIDLINKGVLDEVKAVRPPPSIPQDDARSDVGSSISQKYAGSTADSGVSEQQMIMAVLSQGQDSLSEDVNAVGRSDKANLYYSYIPVLPERQQYRRFDSLGLKDIRKRLDAQYCDQDEIDRITTDLMEDCVALASDYIGNTIIQRLYERASSPLRLTMLDRIAPHLALIGTHKNGTWAAQKIIECSQSPEELGVIARNLAPYVPPLTADSYGNYLVSACLRFGPPFNTFVFDAMVDRVWDIAQTRFGARCMRTCLESPHTSNLQRKRIATAIILHSIPLSTNPNGALLLTWLMDSSELPGRYSLLASRLASYVQHLCTHKLASLTVLRLVSQQAEPDASSTILTAIFDTSDDQVLTDVLRDQVHGVHTIQKIVCGGMGSVNSSTKDMVLAATKRVLEGLSRMTNAFAYKRLLEECGLPVPAGSSNAAPAPTAAATMQPGNGRARGPGHQHAASSQRIVHTPGGSFSTNPGPHSFNGHYRGPYPPGGPRGQPSLHPSQMAHSQGLGLPHGAFGHGGYQPMMAGTDVSMDQMMSSLQAFQLGQGLASQGGLSPIIVPPGGMAGGGNASHGGFFAPPLSPGMTPTPTMGSFNATPHASVMSPNSDPFNPFASPHIMPRASMAPPGASAIRFAPSPGRNESPQFDLSPTFGGLGIQPATTMPTGSTAPVRGGANPTEAGGPNGPGMQEGTTMGWSR